MPLTLASVWILVLGRAVPDVRGGDRGIFVSVAERLLAGDVLYAGVWDNKDPLFYLTTAVSRAVSPYADVLLEAGWILSASLAALRIAGWIGCGRSVALLVGFALTPLIITGTWYYPGYTHLPGVALTLLVFAALTAQRYRLAGALLGTVAFFKLVMLPVAIVLAAVYFLVRRSGRGTKSVLLGFVVTALLVVALLGLRGELAGYLESLMMNFAYSQSSVVEAGHGLLAGHLIRVLTPSVTTAILLIVGVLASEAAMSRFMPQETGRGRGPRTTVWLGAAASLAAGVGMLAVSGVWEHHAQVLYVPAVLTCISLARRCESTVPPELRAPALAAVSVGFVLVVSSPSLIAHSASKAPSAFAASGQLPNEAAGLLAIGESGTYARVGSNNDSGHAFGLRGWDLVCPRFHQYPFDPKEVLDGIVACLPRADALIVSTSRIPNSGIPTWDSYISDVEALLAASYRCSPRQTAWICVRKDATADAAAGAAGSMPGPRGTDGD